MFSLESPLMGIKTYHYQYKKENHPKLSKNGILSAVMGFSLLKGYCTVFQHALKSLEITGIISI